MPIYEYEVKDGVEGCDRCRRPFEVPQRLADPPLAHCPACGAPVRRIVSRVAVGGSRTALDRRAKDAGFTKLQRLGKGEYEKKF